MRLSRRARIILSVCLAQTLLSSLLCLAYFSRHGPLTNPLRFAPYEDPVALNASAADLIPRIIHQTTRDAAQATGNAAWADAHQSVVDLHPGYEIKHWTDATIRAFLKQHYPWFMRTFDAYPQPIQRVDAFRYFALYHYGGVYVDFDIGANKPFDILLKVRVAARLAETGGCCPPSSQPSRESEERFQKHAG